MAVDVCLECLNKYMVDGIISCVVTIS